MVQDAQRPGYVFRGDQRQDEMMKERRANVEAAFLMPYLQAGQSLADFGCGQGTITLGLAAAIDPGQALGFDTQENQIKQASAMAAERGQKNVRFEVGDVYDPPCEPKSLDVVYAHAVLSHLSDPDRVLGNMYRALKPGGLVALRDRSGGPTYTGQPDVHTDGYRLVESVMDAVSNCPYGSQTIGIVLNQLCRKAGFEVLAISGSWAVETAQGFAKRGVQERLPATLAARALSLGLATEAELADLNERFRAWLQDPDAYIAVPWCEVVARKP